MRVPSTSSALLRVLSSPHWLQRATFPFSAASMALLQSECVALVKSNHLPVFRSVRSLHCHEATLSSSLSSVRPVRCGAALRSSAYNELNSVRSRCGPMASAPFMGTVLNPRRSASSAVPERQRAPKGPQAAATAVEVGGTTITRDEVVKEADPTNNVSDAIFSKIGMQLHRRDDHPLGILRNAIYEYFDNNFGDKYEKFDDLFPIVSTKANFDDILIPADHVSRGYNDTYYVNKETVLRCHTSAHQAEMLRNGHTHFLVTGDVYRRDAIDATHYPVFHQMEGFRVFNREEWEAAGVDGTELAATDLKTTLEGLAKHLFGDVEMRWIDAYFPFTEPSYELEIFFQGEWLEVLGCGVTQQAILGECGLADKRAWAFGLGLERLAMVLFEIPDIRLFWSSDKRFTSQFKKGQLGLKFKTFSKFPPVNKDISFWISEDFTENNFCEVVRSLAGDLVEEVKEIDKFSNKAGRTSLCYRLVYRSMERSLTNEEIDAIQVKVRDEVVAKLGVTLR
eukprot:TRINITY_DN109_c0_g1_i1.p1 TRINITY_DN109_c0_g1~~TRINITY_DN109_c0_g1_i1.p1  ORF type:complete len:509 (+),score=86.64 TRINITY_DN109_c0_g1_i1:262-1788(+)